MLKWYDIFHKTRPKWHAYGDEFRWYFCAGGRSNRDFSRKTNAIFFCHTLKNLDPGVATRKMARSVKGSWLSNGEQNGRITGTETLILIMKKDLNPRMHAMRARARDTFKNYKGRHRSVATDEWRNERFISSKIG